MDIKSAAKQTWKNVKCYKLIFKVEVGALGSPNVGNRF